MTDVKLPPLPTSAINSGLEAEKFKALQDFYATDQMTEYARLAVLQERERCAKVCEYLSREIYEKAKERAENGLRNELWLAGSGAATECADAIRKGE